MNTPTLLLKEYYALDRANMVIEQDTIILRGILQRVDTLNGNGRIYERKILERVMNEYNQNFIATKRALGELDHRNSTEVNLSNASHILEHYEWRGNELYGQIRLLSTPSGEIAKKLIKDGITLGISTRGLGSVTQIGNGRVKVNEDYHLVCWDLVHDPSTTGAFMLKEGKFVRLDDVTLSELPEKGNNLHQKVQNIVNDILKKR